MATHPALPGGNLGMVLDTYGGNLPHYPEVPFLDSAGA
jgi:hypothetical protein